MGGKLEDKQAELRTLRSQNPSDQDQRLEKADLERNLKTEIRDLEKDKTIKANDLFKQRADLELQMRKEHGELFRIVHPKVSNGVFQVCKKIVLNGNAGEFVETLNRVKDIFQKNVTPHLAMMNNVVKAVLE